MYNQQKKVIINNSSGEEILPDSPYNTIAKVNVLSALSNEVFNINSIKNSISKCLWFWNI